MMPPHPGPLWCPQCPLPYGQVGAASATPCHRRGSGASGASTSSTAPSPRPIYSPGFPYKQPKPPRVHRIFWSARKRC